ncbi:MAG: hypothetical protein R3B72_43695 [Polyangiaceae bacterium]
MRARARVLYLGGEAADASLATLLAEAAPAAQLVEVVDLPSGSVTLAEVVAPRGSRLRILSARAECLGEAVASGVVGDLAAVVCFDPRPSTRALVEELFSPDLLAVAVSDEPALAIAEALEDALGESTSDSPRSLDVAGYRFEVPSFWGPPTRIEHPPFVGFDAFASHDLGVRVRIAPGAGSEREVDAYLEATRERWSAETRIPAAAEVAGQKLRGERAYGCVDAHSVETLVTAIGCDLLAIHLVTLARHEGQGQLRRLALAILEGAVLAKHG